MIGIVDNALRAKISLLEFLEQRGWRPVRATTDAKRSRDYARCTKTAVLRFM